MEPIIEADKAFRKFWIEDKGEEGECRQERVHVLMDALLQEAFVQGFKAAEANAKAGWAAADALAGAIKRIGEMLQIPAAECVPAIGDVFIEVDKTLAAYTAAKAKRGTA